VEPEQILLKLRERIVAFAASHLQGDIAEDLAQEVLILLHEKYHEVERLEELVPLALKIARFKIMSQRRKWQRHGEYTQVSVSDIQLPDPDANPATLVERKLMLERLTQCVGQLGERCRELMRLKLQGKNFGEIQKRMGAQSINTVYTWDHRCRQQLLELMGGDWEQGNP
jgi:RNA polymerase sigma-70 factor (ECF subfamily)